MAVLQLIKELAWPFVTLVCVYYLFHKGLLKEYFEVIADRIFGVSRNLGEIKEQSKAISEIVDKLSEKLEFLKKGTAELKNSADNLKAVAIDVKDNIDTSIIELNRNQENEQPREPNDQLYKDVKISWDNFVNEIREKFNNPEEFDARSVGVMARRLADNRYRHRIPTISPELADKISNLFSEIKAARRSGINNKIEADRLIQEIKGVTQAISFPPSDPHHQN
jgi:hypothetical protein